MTIHLRIDQLDKTTPTLVTPAGTHSGVDITIQNNSTMHDIFIGTQSVNNNSYGHKLAPGKAVSFIVAPKDSLYILSSGNYGDASILTLGLDRR